MEHRLPLDSLSPEQIEEVIDDLRLMLKGERLHIAIDPHEIYEFCFPINPDPSRSEERESQRGDIQDIADGQAALYEIFFLRKEAPILLDEYREELDRLYHYLIRAVDDAYKDTEMVDELIRRGGLSEITDAEEIGESKLDDMIRKKFNIILAVAMGIYSLGVDRFKEIYNKIFFHGGLLMTSEEMGTALSDYKQTKLRARILIQLEENIYAEGDTLATKKRKRRAAKTDSDAVDHLMAINTALELKHRQNRSEPRHLLLYLSSAPRSKSVFNMPEIKRASPLINFDVDEVKETSSASDKKRYSFWRNRNQIFVYVVFRGKHEDPRKRLEETIENLKNAKQIKEEAEKLKEMISSRSNCYQCVLVPGHRNTPLSQCDFLQSCQRVKDLDGYIRERRTQIYNLGLVRTLEQYEELLNAKPEERHKVIMDLFHRIYKSQVGHLAMERILQTQQLIFLQMSAADMWTRARLSLENGERSRDSSLRGSQDVITGVAQYLPTKPKVGGQKYTQILNLILRYYKAPLHSSRREKINLLDEAYRLFIELDREQKALDAEHELVRCLLYLAFPNVKEGNEKAYSHAGAMLKKEELIGIQPYIETEYLYVQCWAARRLRRFLMADQIATNAIERWPTDARFFHGRSINTYAWLEDKEFREQCPYPVKHAIEDAERAIELFIEDRGENRELVGANYNNIAYLWAWNSFNTTIEDINDARSYLLHAREALEKLKTWIDKDEWYPTYPEYLHTEAYLEYQEFLFGTRQLKNHKEELIEKLMHAQNNIDQAYRAYPKNLYLELSLKIEKGLSYLKAHG